MGGRRTPLARERGVRPRIPRPHHDVTHIVAVAPPQYLPPAEATVATNDDSPARYPALPASDEICGPSRPLTKCSVAEGVGAGSRAGARKTNAGKSVDSSSISNGAPSSKVPSAGRTTSSTGCLETPAQGSACPRSDGAMQLRRQHQQATVHTQSGGPAPDRPHPGRPSAGHGRAGWNARRHRRTGLHRVGRAGPPGRSCPLSRVQQVVQQLIGVVAAEVGGVGEVGIGTAEERGRRAVEKLELGTVG